MYQDEQSNLLLQYIFDLVNDDIGKEFLLRVNKLNPGKRIPEWASADLARENERWTLSTECSDF